MDKLIENLKNQLKKPQDTTQEDGKESSSSKRKCPTIGRRLFFYFDYE